MQTDVCKGCPHYTCILWRCFCIWKGNDPSRFQSSSSGAMYVLLRLVLPMLSQAEIMKMEKQYFSFMFFCKLGRWKPNYRGEMKLQKYLEKLMHYHILYIWKSKHSIRNPHKFSHTMYAQHCRGKVYYILIKTRVRANHI